MGRFGGLLCEGAVSGRMWFEGGQARQLNPSGPFTFGLMTSRHVVGAWQHSWNCRSVNGEQGERQEVSLGHSFIAACRLQVARERNKGACLLDGP